MHDLFRHGTQQPTPHQAMATMANDDKVCPPLFGINHDAFGWVTDLDSMSTLKPSFVVWSRSGRSSHW